MIPVNLMVIAQSKIFNPIQDCIGRFFLRDYPIKISQLIIYNETTNFCVMSCDELFSSSFLTNMSKLPMCRLVAVGSKPAYIPQGCKDVSKVSVWKRILLIVAPPPSQE